MLVHGAASRAGRRSQNEDSWLALPEAGLFAVADGMGGLSAGEEASALAIEAVRSAAGPLQALRGRIEDLRRPDSTITLADLLGSIVSQANNSIYAQGRLRQAHMGTTLTTGLVAGGSVFLSHVGDSRVYRFRGNVGEQLTEDHSAAARRVRTGRASREAYARSSRKAMLYQAVGTGPSVESDFLEVQLEQGDVLVWCTDGVWEPLGMGRLREAAEFHDMQAAAEHLVNAAYEAGSDDNLTAIVVRVLIPGEPSMDWARALGSSAVFAHLDPTELRRLAPYLREVSAAHGEAIVREGSPGVELYLVLEGEVSISRRGVHLIDLGPSDHFGEIALAGETNRTASVHAVGPTRLLVLDREQILELVERRPDLGARLALKLMENLARRVADLTERLVEQEANLPRPIREDDTERLPDD